VPLALNLLDPKSLAGAGVLIIGLVIFAETGILLGLFLPGDTLLFSAGFLAFEGKISLAAVLVVAPVAAIIGGEVGFLLGRRLGPALFSRPDSRLFKQAYLTRARGHSERFGVGKSIVLGRFIPVVRTLIGPFYGASGLPNKVFARWNAIGGVIWGLGVTFVGWAVSKAIGKDRAATLNIDRYLLPLVLLAVLLSFVGLWLELRRARRNESVDTPSQGA
jgi:membrane-associated protein